MTCSAARGCSYHTALGIAAFRLHGLQLLAPCTQCGALLGYDGHGAKQNWQLYHLGSEEQCQQGSSVFYTAQV